MAILATARQMKSRRGWIGIGLGLLGLVAARAGLRAVTGGRGVRLALLSGVVWVYPVLVLAVVVGVALAAVGYSRRRAGVKQPWLARGLALGLSMTVAIALVETAAGVYLAWLHRMPALPSASVSHRGTDDDVHIVVVGESSAEGVPYRDWMSVGKVVAWQLRRAVPWRMFHVEIQARPGWTLEQMHQRLVESRARPDVVILYAGHNEFASRDDWSSDVAYYDDDSISLSDILTRVSPLARLAGEMLDRERIAAPPRPRPRRLVDVPSHTPRQRAERLADFGHRVEAIVAYCERVGALPVLVIPPGNDAGFEPNRSVLPPRTPKAVREAFAREVEVAKGLESVDPSASIERYQNLIGRQPGFAETHFRLARLLEARGDSEDAYRHYVAARDADAHPMRCPSDFQQIYREVARRHDVVLIDGQALFHGESASGQLDDGLFNDAMHPSFAGQVVLAEAILAGLKERRAFGWPAETPTPRIDLAECADRFDVRAATWIAVCEFASSFYRTTVPIRYDAAERHVKERLYGEALGRLRGRRSAEVLGVAGVGLGPVVREARR